MNSEDIGKFPDGRFYFKEGYQPAETQRDSQTQPKQSAIPEAELKPPSFESGVVMPQPVPQTMPFQPDFTVSEDRSAPKIRISPNIPVPKKV